MRYLNIALGIVFWLAVAYIPIGIAGLEGEFRVFIGCQPYGDCHGAGSLLLPSFQKWQGVAFVLLWPLVIVKLFKLLFGKKKDVSPEELKAPN